MKVAHLLSVTLMSLVALILSGCGESTGPTGTLQGKVTYKGGAVPPGASVVVTNDQDGGAAEIDSSGNYALKKAVRVGNYTLVVNPPKSNQTPEEAMKASMEGKKPDELAGIPKKYRNASTTPAKLEIKAGKNDFSLDMTDE